MASSKPPPASRRSPKTDGAQLTVDAVLEAAYRLAQAEGAASITTTRVAERAGVGVGTVYQYFADRAALLRAVEERAYAVVGARIAARMVQLVETAPEEATYAIVREAVEAITAHGLLFGITADDESVTQSRVMLVEQLADLALSTMGPHRPLRGADHPRLTMLIAIKTVALLSWIGLRDHGAELSSGVYQDEVARMITRYLYAR